MFHTYLLGNRGPTTKESDLGELDNIAATESAKKKRFEKLCEVHAKAKTQHRKIRKMATAAAVRKFRKERPNLNESSV